MERAPWRAVMASTICSRAKEVVVETVIVFILACLVYWWGLLP